MPAILNLTQHQATPAQLEDGVIDLSEHHQKVLRQLLTFNEMPSYEKVMHRVDEIVRLQTITYPTIEKVMLGGAPFLVTMLDWAFRCKGIRPVYAFSKRVTEETRHPDGSVTKVNTFRHEGFVELI